MLSHDNDPRMIPWQKATKLTIDDKLIDKLLEVRKHSTDLFPLTQFIHIDRHQSQYLHHATVNIVHLLGKFSDTPSGHMEFRRSSTLHFHI